MVNNTKNMLNFTVNPFFQTPKNDGDMTTQVLQSARYVRIYHVLSATYTLWAIKNETLLFLR